MSKIALIVLLVVAFILQITVETSTIDNRTFFEWFIALFTVGGGWAYLEILDPIRPHQTEKHTDNLKTLVYLSWSVLLSAAFIVMTKIVILWVIT